MGDSAMVDEGTTRAIARGASVTVGLAGIAIGVYNAFIDVADMSAFLIAVYVVFFCSLGIAAQFDVELLNKEFSFFGSFKGRGAFFLFIGSLECGLGWLGWTLGGTTMAIGLAIMCSGSGDEVTAG